ncbi:MAG: cyclase family protein [Candidatus Thermoplasmatota archaeon]
MYVLLSYNIDKDTPVYGGREGFKSKTQTSISDGDSANTAIWCLPNHIGTHVDFPYHFYEDGQTINDFPLAFWLCNGDTVQLIDTENIEEEYLVKPEHLILENYNRNAEVVLLKTNMYRYRGSSRYWEYNLGVSLELEEWLREKFKKIRIFGLDSISISSWQHREIGRTVHRKFLNPKKPVLIVEDMKLSGLDRYTVFRTIFFVPFMIDGADAVPCTVIGEIK